MIDVPAVRVRPRKTKQYRRTIDCTSDRDSAISTWLIARAIEVNRDVRRTVDDERNQLESLPERLKSTLDAILS